MIREQCSVRGHQLLCFVVTTRVFYWPGLDGSSCSSGHQHKATCKEAVTKPIWTTTCVAVYVYSISPASVFSVFEKCQLAPIHGPPPPPITASTILQHLWPSNAELYGVVCPLPEQQNLRRREDPLGEERAIVPVPPPPSTVHAH